MSRDRATALQPGQQGETPSQKQNKTTKQGDASDKRLAGTWHLVAGQVLGEGSSRYSYIWGLAHAEMNQPRVKVFTGGRAGWLTPVIQHTGRPRPVDHLRSGVHDQPGQHGETLSLLKVQKISQAWWRVLVIPATGG